MNPSLTLRRLLALPEHPAPLHESVLLMIDLQNTYRRGVMQLDGVEPAVAEAARLLARARIYHVPVIHVMHDAGPGSPYDIQAEIGQISPEVSPAPGELVIVKKYPSAFVQTGLEQSLRNHGRTDLVIAGFMTHMCVNSTARDAFNFGYRPTVVAAATATRALPGADGDPVPAPVLQSAGLAMLADLFALVVGKSDDIPD